jgi:hypothetical protein
MFVFLKSTRVGFEIAIVFVHFFLWKSAIEHSVADSAATWFFLRNVSSSSASSHVTSLRIVFLKSTRLRSEIVTVNVTIFLEVQCLVRTSW